MIVTCKNIVKGCLHVRGVQRRGLDETQVVLLSKCFRLVCGHSAQVTQVGLVPHLGRMEIIVLAPVQIIKDDVTIFYKAKLSHSSLVMFVTEMLSLHFTHQHDDNVGVSVVPQLPQPPLHVLVGEMLGCSRLQLLQITVILAWQSPIS